MDNIVKFDKPYKFEGKEYDSLDLSGMEKVFPFLVPLRRPLKFFSVAQMPTPAPSNVCPIFPRRVVGCCAPAPAI